MRRILASTFVLAVLGGALAAPPIDYELRCDDALIGVLSLTEGKVHVALLADAACEGALAVEGPEDAPGIAVTVIDWDADPPTVEVTVDEVAAEVVDLVVVPADAIDGMLNAQRLRAAAMAMRREAAQKGELDRDRTSWDEEGAPGSGQPGGPPADEPPSDGQGGPPDDAPRGDPAGEGPGGRP